MDFKVRKTAKCVMCEVHDDDQDDHFHGEERAAISCGLLVPGVLDAEGLVLLHTPVKRARTLSQGTARLPKKQNIGEQLFPLILLSSDSPLFLSFSLSHAYTHTQYKHTISTVQAVNLITQLTGYLFFACL